MSIRFIPVGVSVLQKRKHCKRMILTILHLFLLTKGKMCFSSIDGSEGKSCASCHKDVEQFAGLKATLPRVENGKLVTMENLVNDCRTERMGADAWKWSSSKNDGYDSVDFIAITRNANECCY